jgi:hypothetical protein
MTCRRNLPPDGTVTEQYVVRFIDSQVGCPLLVQHGTRQPLKHYDGGGLHA